MRYKVVETEHCIIRGSDNWDELTPERQEEMREIYADHMINAFYRKLDKEKEVKSV